MPLRVLFIVLLLGLVVANSAPRAAQAPAQPAQISAQDAEQIRLFLQRLQAIFRTRDGAGWFALVADSADMDRARSFANTELRPGATGVVVIERDREAVSSAAGGTTYRLLVDAMVEFGTRARAATWRFELTKSPDGSFKVVHQDRLSALDRLYRLSVNNTKQYTARNFTLRAEDIELTLEEGSVFTVDADQTTTGLVLLGRGTMKFQPTSEIEKGQMRVFADEDFIDTRFDAAFLRVGTIGSHADMSKLTPRPVDPRELRRAEEVFREEVGKTYTVDLADLSPELWSMLPGSADFVSEVRTRKFGTLTYSRSEAAAEDISLFDRTRQKNIAVYASKERLASRGRFYVEDDLADFDVLDYEIDATFVPERRWLDARARLRIKVRTNATNQISLRLSDSLTVRNVTSDEFGRLFSVRVANHNTMLVNLPVVILRDGEVTLTITYSGGVGPSGPEWETLPVSRREFDLLNGGVPQARLDQVYLVSNRSDWYPHSAANDYADATLRLTIPAAFECVASGTRSPNSPTLIDSPNPLERRKQFVFTAERPLRYLSFLVTHLMTADRATVAFDEDGESARLRGPAMGGAVYDSLDFTMMAHPRVAEQAARFGERSVSIAQYFRSLVGDSPYGSLTVVLLEGNSPGGHSPGYFAAVRQPPKDAARLWRNDPAAFDNYPEFFTAHEIAHQWWGQAVGWNTYHDQWLSESFAQYFAALYTGRERGPSAFGAIMRQMRRWAIDKSDQGPVYLGYRLGHVRDDGRVFRALVYDKGAVVLHMLRRLVGDETFFLGLRRFYATWRFQKASTEDFRHAMEAESGRSLERFFDRWIYGASLPQLTFSYRVESSPAGREAVLRVNQAGDIFDVPVTALLQVAGQPPLEVTIRAADRTTEMRVLLKGALRNIEVNRDEILGDIQIK